ncbi:collagen alpha-1(I) chain-like [Ammospiza caudacuta]|uniref:collagen alpha-1(I) chain-like n=1 Tax=Ammospiza caudacuta TaxID=2857398 RepID=UPI002739EBF9|nr:collagen alpha-1(I) chain-like [Ammospiza caudacuta]
MAPPRDSNPRLEGAQRAAAASAALPALIPPAPLRLLTDPRPEPSRYPGPAPNPPGYPGPEPSRGRSEPQPRPGAPVPTAPAEETPPAGTRCGQGNPVAIIAIEISARAGSRPWPRAAGGQRQLCASCAPGTAHGGVLAGVGAPPWGPWRPRGDRGAPVVPVPPSATPVPRSLPGTVPTRHPRSPGAPRARPLQRHPRVRPRARLGPPEPRAGPGSSARARLRPAGTPGPGPRHRAAQTARPRGTGPGTGRGTGQGGTRGDGLETGTGLGTGTGGTAPPAPRVRTRHQARGRERGDRLGTGTGSEPRCDTLGQPWDTIGTQGRGRARSHGRSSLLPPRAGPGRAPRALRGSHAPAAIAALPARPGSAAAFSRGTGGSGTPPPVPTGVPGGCGAAGRAQRWKWGHDAPVIKWLQRARCCHPAARGVCPCRSLGGDTADRAGTPGPSRDRRSQNLRGGSGSPQTHRGHEPRGNGGAEPPGRTGDIPAGRSRCPPLCAAPACHPSMGDTSGGPGGWQQDRAATCASPTGEGVPGGGGDTRGARGSPGVAEEAARAAGGGREAVVAFFFNYPPVCGVCCELPVPSLRFHPPDPETGAGSCQAPGPRLCLQGLKSPGRGWSWAGGRRESRRPGWDPAIPARPAQWVPGACGAARVPRRPSGSSARAHEDGAAGPSPPPLEPYVPPVPPHGAGHGAALSAPVPAGPRCPPSPAFRPLAPSPSATPAPRLPGASETPPALPSPAGAAQAGAPRPRRRRSGAVPLPKPPRGLRRGSGGTVPMPQRPPGPRASPPKPRHPRARPAAAPVRPVGAPGAGGSGARAAPPRGEAPAELETGPRRPCPARAVTHGTLQPPLPQFPCGEMASASLSPAREGGREGGRCGPLGIFVIVPGWKIVLGGSVPGPSGGVLPALPQPGPGPFPVWGWGGGRWDPRAGGIAGIGVSQESPALDPTGWERARSARRVAALPCGCGGWGISPDLGVPEAREGLAPRRFVCVPPIGSRVWGLRTPEHGVRGGDGAGRASPSRAHSCPREPGTVPGLAWAQLSPPGQQDPKTRSAARGAHPATSSRLNPTCVGSAGTGGALRGILGPPETPTPTFGVPLPARVTLAGQNGVPTRLRGLQHCGEPGIPARARGLRLGPAVGRERGGRGFPSPAGTRHRQAGLGVPRPPGGAVSPPGVWGCHLGPLGDPGSVGDTAGEAIRQCWRFPRSSESGTDPSGLQT